jgi:hypothetical protein
VNSLTKSKSKFLNSLILIVVVLSASQCTFNQYTFAQPQITDPQLKIDVPSIPVTLSVLKWGSKGSSLGELNKLELNKLEDIEDIAMNDKTGEVFVTDTKNSRVQVFQLK